MKAQISLGGLPGHRITDQQRLWAGMGTHTQIITQSHSHSLPSAMCHLNHITQNPRAPALCHMTGLGWQPLLEQFCSPLLVLN